MEHKERLAIARKLAKQLKPALYIGLYGSTARGEDGPHSDIELIIITKKKTDWKFFIYKDVLISTEFKSEKHVVNWFKWVDIYWPEGKEAILRSIPLHNPKYLEKLKKIYNSLPDEAFLKASKRALTQTFEYVGKLKNAYLKRDLSLLREAAIYHLYHNLCMLVGLLNHRAFCRSGVGMLKDMRDWKKPKKFIQLAKMLWQSNEPDQLYEAVIQLWQNCLDFAAEFGVKPAVADELDVRKFV